MKVTVKVYSFISYTVIKIIAGHKTLLSRGV